MLAVGLYVAGMIVDYLAWLLTRPLKPLVPRWAERKYKRWGSEAQSGTLRQAKKVKYPPRMTNEPCSMLMTFNTPHTSEKPTARHA